MGSATASPGAFVFYRTISTPKLLGSGEPMEIFPDVQGKGWHQCQPLLAPDVPLWCPQGCPLGAAAGVSHPAWYRGSLVRQAVTQAVASPRGTPVAGGSPASVGQVTEALCPSSTLCSLWGRWRGLQATTEHGVTLQTVGTWGACSQAECVGRRREQHSLPSLPFTPRPQPQAPCSLPACVSTDPHLSARDMTAH